MKTPRPTLAATLTRRLLWLAAAVTAANVVFVSVYYARDVAALQAAVVDREMARLEAELAVAPPDAPAVPQDALSLYRAHPGAYGYALLDAEGRILQSANAALVPDPALDTGMFADDWLSRRPGPTGETVIASHVVPLPAGAKRVIFVVADDPAGLMRRAIWHEFVGHVWLPLLPVALILILASVSTIRGGLAPLARAAAWARSVRPGDPPPSFPDQDLPAEVADLADATRRMAERLSAALEAERRRAAEAAHALRTPLAVLVARLDAVPPGPERDALADDLRALRRMVDQLLAATRAETLPAPDGVQVDLVAVAEAVVSGLAPMAVARGAEIALVRRDGIAAARGVADAVELALANLVENAILHGASQVEVVVGPGACVVVRDDGPGLPKGAGARPFEPFWRGPHAPAGGAGLGLAIVARVQRSLGGAVEARDRPGGGAEMRLTYRPA